MGLKGLGLGWESHMAAGSTWPSVLHSLKGLGLGRDHKGRGCGPDVEFGSGREVGGLGRHHCAVGWRGLREARRLSIFLEGCYGWWTRAVTTLGTAVDHRLGGGGTGARAARA